MIFQGICAKKEQTLRADAKINFLQFSGSIRYRTRYSKFLVTNSYQFGFKKGSNCDHAIYSVRKVVDHCVVGGSTSRSNSQKLRISSSVIVTYIPIESRQFPASSFWLARYLFFAAMTLALFPWPWNWTVAWIFWSCIPKLKMKLLGQTIQGI